MTVTGMTRSMHKLPLDLLSGRKKTLNYIHNNIEAHHTYLVFEFYLFAACTFYRNMSNMRYDRLPV